MTGARRGCLLVDASSSSHPRNVVPAWCRRRDQAQPCPSRVFTHIMHTLPDPDMLTRSHIPTCPAFQR